MMKPSLSNSCGWIELTLWGRLNAADLPSQMRLGMTSVIVAGYGVLRTPVQNDSAAY